MGQTKYVQIWPGQEKGKKKRNIPFNAWYLCNG